jgi:sugar transferase (PEP-CTERM system associated)
MMTVMSEHSQGRGTGFGVDLCVLNDDHPRIPTATPGGNTQGPTKAGGGSKVGDNAALAAAVLEFERKLTESKQRLLKKRASLPKQPEPRTRLSPMPMRTLVLGAGPLTERIAAHLRANPKAYSFVGCLDRPAAETRAPSVLGDIKDLDEIVARERVDCVVVALSERRGCLPLEPLLACKLSGISVEDGVAFLEKISGKTPIAGLNPGALIFSDGFRWPAQASKRAVDILFALLFLLLAAPAFLLLPALIRLTSPGPVFYRQERVGLNGRRFAMLKFRSMVEHAEKGYPVWARENDPRVTPLGGLMRQFRLDELPQLLNVLRGDMSFVGPRPERPQFVELLRNAIPYYNLRHTVKPGITGWAQIKFRYGASVEDAAEKLQYDLYYVKHMSVLFDCLITLKTFHAVLFQSGAR